MGTEWPLVVRVDRRQWGRARPTWVVTQVCNGIAERAVACRTRRGAQAIQAMWVRS
jgi:hypothetical protein